MADEAGLSLASTTYYFESKEHLLTAALERAAERDIARLHIILGQVRNAQTSAPFGDGRGLVASTLQDGDTLPPIEQALSTPFQTIPERVVIVSVATGPRSGGSSIAMSPSSWVSPMLGLPPDVAWSSGLPA